MSLRRILSASLLLALAPTLAPAADDHIRARITQSYPEILALWADGQEQAALEKLDELETPLIRPKKVERDVEDLWRAKLGVIRQTIERSSVEVLVPIMLLHHDAYRHYVAKRSSRLALHSLVMSAELAEFYAARSNDPRSARHAGDLLTSLAGHLQSGHVTRRAADLFDRALEVDATNAAANMGLGALYERRGGAAHEPTQIRAELSRAAEHYAAAAHLAPDSAEALLRYGICETRLGELREAERQFDRVLALGEPAWVVKFAFQEKARIQEELSAGTGIAREGRQEFPDSSRQAIQLAFLLERQRQSRSALSVLDEIADVAEPESERYHYARWPHDLLVTVRTRLRESATDSNEMLASATFATPRVASGE